MPELIVKKGSKIFFRIPILKGFFKIGRSLDNDLSLPDEDVSRQHAEIVSREGVFNLCDKSRGGTRVGENFVENEYVLSDGDEITIGSWSLIFRVHTSDIESRAREGDTCITQISDDPPTNILKLDTSKNEYLVEKPILRIKEGNNQTRDIPLTKNSTLIGSKPDCDVHLSDDYVSGHHCRVYKKGQSLYVEDLDSTNGTLLRGARINESPLQKSDVLQIGETTLTLDWVQGSEKVQPLSHDHFLGMVGLSEVMRSLFSKIKRVAGSDLSVLIQGETGSGKELVARALHDLSPRKNGAYIILNCGAISPNLIESELFGHEKGAFTGAYARHLGAFEAAHGGTLLLDEIGELPIELQPKLLRVLENQTLRRVGGTSEIPVDVRVIAATHRYLKKKVGEGSFREDLFYRLEVVSLTIPPLRERSEDILILAKYFLSQASKDKPKTLSLRAEQKLLNHNWPGNVRELKNVILRSLVFCDEDVIDNNDLETIPDAPSEGQRANLGQIEKEKIQEILLKTEGNKTKAAELLGIAKSTLFKKLKEYDLQG